MSLNSMSVVICTRNRSAFLKKCLVSLVAQDLASDVKFEVIVVDNDSSDNTRDIAFLYEKNFWRFKYFCEKKIGLAHARNSAVSLCSTEIIVYLDDDATADIYFINEMHNAFKDKTVDCVGGRIIADWYNNKVPDWYSNEIGHIVGETSFGGRSRFLGKDEFPFGGNMAFRKSCFREKNPFNFRLGKKNDNFLYGEEIDFFYRLKLKRKRFYYKNKAVVYHYVSKERATKRFFLNGFYGKGVTEGYQKRKHKGYLFFLCYFLVKLGLLFLYASIRFFEKREGRRFYRECQIVYNLGYIYYFLVRPFFG